MKYIVSYLVISLFSNSLAQGFEAKENSGLNKLERINSVETYMVKMDATIKTMKSELKNLQGPSKLKELVDSLSRNQESLKNEIEQIRTVDISQLQSDIEFVDKEKVEKLIDKFLKIRMKKLIRHAA